MAKEAFYEAAYIRKATLEIIKKANSIIEPLVAQGYTLTVRQLYYQFVRRNWLENKQSNYQRLASILDDARKRGMIDWEAIEDRTRYLRRIPNFKDPIDFINKMIERYAEDLWRDQEVYCEVWIEKDALLGVVERPCNEYRVPFLACRGYASSSELYSAGKRLARRAANGKRCIVFHLGDHDPSGLDMTRVNEDSLNVFSRWSNIEVRRLALNRDQIDQYNPPPNPAKDSDARYEGYKAEHGESCWELDALEVEVLDKIIRDNIEAVLDRDDFDNKLSLEADNRAALEDVSINWRDVERFMKYRFKTYNVGGSPDDWDISPDELIGMIRDNQDAEDEEHED